MNEDGGSCVVPTEWKVAAGTMSIYRSVSRNCYLLPLSSAREEAEQVQVPILTTYQGLLLQHLLSGVSTWSPGWLIQRNVIF